MSASEKGIPPEAFRMMYSQKAFHPSSGEYIRMEYCLGTLLGDAYQAALAFGDCLLLLDRYFLTVPALQKLKSLNDSGDVRMEIVTKAKRSCTAFQKPGPRKPGRGRPPKKGAAVHLKELFVSHKGQFQEVQTELYGKKETIRYCCVDLLWGQKLYQELRFVPVEMGILQSLSVRYIGKVSSSQIRYQRTPSRGRVSEAALMHYFRKHFFRLLEQKPTSCITQIFHSISLNVPSIPPTRLRWHCI